jgi:Tfp pilus assembly protein PilF/predicted aspartyl protease
MHSPIISIMIDDQPRKVLLDTGGFWSLINPQIIGDHRVRQAALVSRLGLQGLPLEKSVMVSSVQIGKAVVKDVEFYIAPQDYLDFDATLGANWLRTFDVEIDPVKNTASLFSTDHCDGKVAYWPHNDLAIIPFDLESVGNHVKLDLQLNGETVATMIDTGSPDTVLSLRAAKRLFDLTPESSGMQPAGASKDAHGGEHKAYRFQFKSLEMGDIGFKNPWITIAEIAGGGQDMILGMHQLHALHLYFAYKERKLYATSVAGDIAAAKAAGGQTAAAIHVDADPLKRLNAEDYRRNAYAAVKKDDLQAALAEIEKAIQQDPTYAEAYLTRAGFHQAKGQNNQAMKDYEEALRLAPDNVDAYLDRARLKWRLGDKSGAIGDANLAVIRAPSDTGGYLARALFETRMEVYDKALTDASEAVRLAPNDPKPLSGRAQVYARMGDYAHAYEDQTLVVKLEPKSTGSLNNRCWFGAILGKLDDALDDCNAAIDIDPKYDAAWDSRGFVRLKMGQWDRAIKDFTAALELNPKQASSLFGRAQAKQQKGDAAGAAADIAAAKQIDPDIEKHFGK